jgi:hypothetical protein
MTDRPPIPHSRELTVIGDPMSTDHDPACLSDALIAALAPAIDAGNTYAMVTLVRLLGAEDVEAETRVVINEWATAFSQMVAVCVPLLEHLGLTDDPNACWRCNALRAETDVGLCESCRADLIDTSSRR